MAAQMDKSVNKERVLNDLLKIAKKNGMITSKDLDSAVKMLDLDKEQQTRMYAALDSMGVTIVGKADSPAKSSPQAENTAAPAAASAKEPQTEAPKKAAAKPRKAEAKAKPEDAAIDKEQVLRDFLDIAKSSGKITSKQVGRTIESLALNDEQQDQLYEALEQAGVEIAVVEGEGTDTSDSTDFDDVEEVTEEDVQSFRDGLVLPDGLECMPAELEITRRCTASDIADEGISRISLADDPDAPVTEVLITIREGKFHQIKRMFQAIGSEVIYLKRLSFGTLQLDPELETGEYRRLTDEEISALREL
jgi:hypothetical protein